MPGGWSTAANRRSRSPKTWGCPGRPCTGGFTNSKLSTEKWLGAEEISSPHAKAPAAASSFPCCVEIGGLGSGLVWGPIQRELGSQVVPVPEEVIDRQLTGKGMTGSRLISRSSPWHALRVRTLPARCGQTR